MFFKRDRPKQQFMGVAIATLLVGAIIIALGVVELGFNFWGTTAYSVPTYKIIGGLIVMSLGYIHLELEMLRIDKK